MLILKRNRLVGYAFFKLKISIREHATHEPPCNNFYAFSAVPVSLPDMFPVATTTRSCTVISGIFPLFVYFVSSVLLLTPLFPFIRWFLVQLVNYLSTVSGHAVPLNTAGTCVTLNDKSRFALCSGNLFSNLEVHTSVYGSGTEP